MDLDFIQQVKSGNTNSEFKGMCPSFTVCKRKCYSKMATKQPWKKYDTYFINLYKQVEIMVNYEKSFIKITNLLKYEYQN